MQAENRVTHFMDTFRVQTIAWFIQNQQLRIRQQCLSQGQPGAHSMRIRPHFRRLTPTQSYPFDDFRNPLVGSWRGIRGQDFEITAAAEIVIKGRAFENCSYALQRTATVRRDVITTDADLTGRGPDLAEHHANGCTFASTIVTE